MDGLIIWETERKVKMKRAFFSIVLAAALCVPVLAADADSLRAEIAQCQQNKASAHHVAEVARSGGYPEDGALIRAASDWWWSEHRKQLNYQAELDELLAEPEFAPFLYTLDCADAGYTGHPVSLTERQREKVLRALVGEQGMDNTFEIYVGSLQYIVDYIEYGTLARSYDNIGSFWLKSAAGARANHYSLSTIESNEALMEAYDYVMNQGGRLFQHVMGGYWDDDDAAGIDTFQQNVRATCGGGHGHDWVTCVNENYANEWVRFWVCTNRKAK